MLLKAFAHTFIKAKNTQWNFVSNTFSACKFIIERCHLDGISTKIEHLSQILRKSSKPRDISMISHRKSVTLSQIRHRISNTHVFWITINPIRLFLTFFSSHPLNITEKPGNWGDFEANPTFHTLDGDPTGRIAYRYENQWADPCPFLRCQCMLWYYRILVLLYRLAT